MVEILNYQSDLQGIKTFINKPVLWPVYEYTVAVKGLPSFGDNELETLVLRLAQINIRDVNEIAKCSGLEPDLVAFIQERLNHKGFLDEFMQLTENGLAKISNSNNAENVQYMMMYRDAVSGDMLSKILREETRNPLHYFQDQESMMQEEGSTKYFSFKDLTTVGDEEIESKRFAAFDPIVPKIKAELSTDDIKSVIKKNGLTAGNCSFSSSGEGKLVYLKVVMILQEGNTTDWLCTDGFGNLSPFFGSRIKYLNSQNQEYIKGLRKQSIISDASYSYSKKDTSDEMLEWRAYPQIGKYLKDSEELLAEIKDSNPNNSGEVEALVQTKVECTEKIYSLIEWIFFYKNYSQVNEIKSALGKLLQNTEKYTERIIGPEVLKVAFNKLKFNTVKETDKPYFNVPVGRIRHSLKEGDSHELFALFAAAVLQARENDDCWIYKVAQENPDFMNQIIQMKVLRDSAAHSNRSTGIEYEQLKQYLELAVKLINICYEKNKEIVFRKKKHQIYDFAVHNKQNKQMAWLEEQFGFQIISVLPERFLGIAKTIANACMDGEAIQPVAVLYMSKLLEQCFAHLNQNVNQINLPNDKWFDYAMSRALSASFIANGEYKALRNAKPSRIRRAVEGKKATLQAGFLAWLCTENEADLKSIAKDCNYLVEHINKVSDLRGHEGIPEEETFKAANPRLLLNRTIGFIKKLATSDYFYNN